MTEAHGRDHDPLAGAVAEGRAGQLLNRITDAYRAADALLTEEVGYNVIEDSGTTCALALLKDDLLLSPKVPAGALTSLGISFICLPLLTASLRLPSSPDHDCSTAESARIEKAGGEVRGEGAGGRVYAKGQQFPGLAVARCCKKQIEAETGTEREKR
eukprot:500509-Hanusia_phi.AAC.1